MYCECESPDLITNTAGGKVFKVCKTCKKESGPPPVGDIKESKSQEGDGGASLNAFYTRRIAEMEQELDALDPSETFERDMLEIQILMMKDALNGTDNHKPSGEEDDDFWDNPWLDGMND